MGILIVIVIAGIAIWIALRAKPQLGYVSSDVAKAPSRDVETLYWRYGFSEDLKWNWAGGRSLAVDLAKNQLAYFPDPRHKSFGKVFNAKEIRAIVVFANKKPLFWHTEMDGQAEYCISTYHSSDESPRTFKLILTDANNYHRINLVIFSRDQIEMDFIDTPTPIGSKQSEEAIERAKEWLLLIASLMSNANNESEVEDG